MANRNSYFGHMIWPDDGLEKMFGKVKGNTRKRRQWKKLVLGSELKRLPDILSNRNLLLLKTDEMLIICPQRLVRVEPNSMAPILSK